MLNSLPKEYWDIAHRARARNIPKIDVDHSEANAVVRMYDNEVQVLAGLMAQAKKKRNNLRRPVALPYELLVRVFEFVTLLCHNVYTRKEPSWLPIAHVCSRWREVALRHSPLWATITLSSSKLPIELMVERSRAVPLHIVCETARPTDISYIEKLLHRAETLRITGKILQRLPEDATGPILESIILDDVTSTPTSVRPSMKFIANHSHTLRHVVLKSYPFPWSSVFTNIQKLALYMPASLDASDDTIKDILESLKNMSSLEHLCLRGVLPSSVENPPSTVVSLHQLRVLSLFGPYSSIEALWSSLVIPTDTSISLVFSDSSGHERTLAKLSNWSKSPDSARYKHSRVNVQDDYMVARFTMQWVPKYPKVKNTFPLPDSCSGPEFVVCIRVPRNLHSEATYNLAVIASDFPLESFCIAGHRIVWSREKFRSFLARTGALKHIEHLSHASPESSLHDALLDDEDADDDCGKVKDAQVVCPMLETVCVTGSGIGSRSFDVAKLVKSLKRRIRSGVGLHTLQLITWTANDEPVDSDTITSLKTCVREVVPLQEEKWTSIEGSATCFSNVRWWQEPTYYCYN